VEDVIANDAARDPFAKKVYGSWKAFLENQKKWADTNVIPYLDARQG